jgi:hypothetical protein
MESSASLLSRQPGKPGLGAEMSEEFFEIPALFGRNLRKEDAGIRALSEVDAVEPGIISDTESILVRGVSRISRFRYPANPPVRGPEAEVWKALDLAVSRCFRPGAPCRRWSRCSRKGARFRPEGDEGSCLVLRLSGYWIDGLSPFEGRLYGFPCVVQEDRFSFAFSVKFMTSFAFKRG